MGYAARANKSAKVAKAAGYRKPERVTVARVRRQRRGEARGHMASLVAMQAIAALISTGQQSIEVDLAGRLARQMNRKRGGLLIVNRDPEPDDRENVSGANALQREAVTVDPADAAVAQEGAALTDIQHSIEPQP